MCSILYTLFFLSLGGFDSDVERERTIDYVSKTYVNPIREATLGGAKPQPVDSSPKAPRKGASRNVTVTPKVTTRPEEETVDVKVREREGKSTVCVCV